jgi:hypothetical protein
MLLHTEEGGEQPEVETVVEGDAALRHAALRHAALRRSAHLVALFPQFLASDESGAQLMQMRRELTVSWQ